MSSILVIGESGSGKSTSLRNLNSESTYIINALNKPLPFKGWVKKVGSNIFFTDNAQKITTIINDINKNRSEITTIVIDDFQAVMTNEFMRTSLEAGYQKFTRLGKGIWDIVNAANNTRSNLKVILLAHSDTDQNGKIKCKTVGKLVDEKISVEGMCTIVFHSKAIEGKYVFLTQNDGISIAKSPMGMFATQKIDNDFDKIIETIDSYYADEELPIVANQWPINPIKQACFDLISKIENIEELTNYCTKMANEYESDTNFVNQLREKYKERKEHLEFIAEMGGHPDQRGDGEDVVM